MANNISLAIKLNFSYNDVNACNYLKGGTKRMAKVHIVTDSTSDLPQHILIERSIQVVPLYVNFNDEIFKDDIDINPSLLYKKVQESGIYPKTSSPSPKDFIDFFKPIVDKGDQVLYIGLSSQLSSTIQNARIAASEFPDHTVLVVDSLNLSAGIGMLVLEASDLALQGKSLEEISKVLHAKVPKVKTFFAVDTLQYLHKGGRCSSLQNLIGTMFRVRPILHVVNGKIIVQKKVRGKREKQIDEMLQFPKSESNSISIKRIIVNHSFCPDDAELLRKELDKSFSPEEIVITEAGCVISSHCGPNTFSIVYCLE